jgi:hypothetical protein
MPFNKDGSRKTMAYSKPSTFKMKGFSGFGNSPIKADPTQGTGGEEKSNRLTLKGPNSLKSRVEGFFSKLRGNIEKDVASKIESGTKSGLIVPRKSAGKDKTGTSEDVARIVKKHKEVKTKTTDYSKMKSVNALVADRKNWKTNNPGKKYPGQSEINKRLSENPNKWD